MGWTARIERLLPDVAGVVTRFPVAVAASVLLCAYQLYSGTLDLWRFYDVQLALMAAFFAGGAAHLFAEGRRLGKIPGLVVAACVGLAAAAIFYFSQWLHGAGLFFFGGVVPALMVAPFLRHGARQGAIWLFNLRLGLAFLLATVVGVVFGLGLSTVVAGLNFLFSVDLGNVTFERIWTVALLLVGPIFGLALMPKDLDEEVDLEAHRGSLLERGVSVLVNYVLVPLALIYAAILHAYAAKIAVLQTLPKGEIGTIVSLFALGGTVTWLIGWPWREKGTVLLRWFMRGWFWLLPVPAALLATAIWRRVSDYGVTPDRYGIALVAVWTALLFVYLLWRRNKADMRAIVGSAAVLLLAGSFGPWGAYSTTAVSQVARLQAALEKAGILKGGKVVSPLPPVGSVDTGEGYSIVTTLVSVNGLPRIASWFDKPPVLVVSEDKGWWDVTADVSAALGLAWNRNGFLNLSPNLPLDRTWTGAVRLVGPLNNLSIDSQPVVAAGVELKMGKDELTISKQGSLLHFSLAKLHQQLAEEAKKEFKEQSPVVSELSDTVSLIVENASGQTQSWQGLTLNRFWLVLRE